MSCLENDTGEQNFQRDGFLTTNLEQVLNWTRAGSFGLDFGLACCAVGMMHAGASRYDLDRFGGFRVLGNLTYDCCGDTL